MNFDFLTRYGPWGLVVGAVVFIAKLLIAKGYRIKIDVGPDR